MAKVSLPMIRHREGSALEDARTVPEETPVAIVHDAMTYAVMMATPADLEDFAIGFSFTEGIIQAADEISAFEVIQSPRGIEVRLWLPPGRAASLIERRRTLTGPTGCGLCGVESLEQVWRAPSRPLHPVAALTAADILAAMAALEPLQPLGRTTRAVHAAGFWQADRGMTLVREDVGRHNAVDKLAGALIRAGEAAAGVLVLTSRVSVELVQKAAAMGVPVIAAVSAPTDLAVRTAQAAGITLIAVARADGFEIFSHPHRIAL